MLLTWIDRKGLDSAAEKRRVSLWTRSQVQEMLHKKSAQEISLERIVDGIILYIYTLFLLIVITIFFKKI